MKKVSKIPMIFAFESQILALPTTPILKIQ